ncbi:hypothetical protein [Streptomyces sp. YKOK-I1]
MDGEGTDLKEDEAEGGRTSPVSPSVPTVHWSNEVTSVALPAFMMR